MATSILKRAVPAWIKGPAKKVFFSRVNGGPFTGMRYVETSCCGAFFPKVLGTYEMEIWKLLAPCLKWESGLFVDVGAAEGYYAVGMLVRNSRIRTLAFEADATTREILARLGRLNQVTDRLDVKGCASHKELEEALHSERDVFALFDIEGAEFDLLDPMRVPSLCHVRFVVEIHDWVHPDRDADSIFRSRFGCSHEITEVKARIPKPSDIGSPFWRVIARMNTTLADRLLNERPPIMRWFCFVPIQGRNGYRVTQSTV